MVVARGGACMRVFSLQAAACADAGAALISPFVGRIMDWYKAKEGRDFTPEEVRLSGGARWRRLGLVPGWWCRVECAGF